MDFYFWYFSILEKKSKKFFEICFLLTIADVGEVGWVATFQWDTVTLHHSNHAIILLSNVQFNVDDTVIISKAVSQSKESCPLLAPTGALYMMMPYYGDGNFLILCACVCAQNYTIYMYGQNSE